MNKLEAYRRRPQREGAAHAFDAVKQVYFLRQHAASLHNVYKPEDTTMRETILNNYLAAAAGYLARHPNPSISYVGRKSWEAISSEGILMAYQDSSHVVLDKLGLDTSERTPEQPLCLPITVLNQTVPLFVVPGRYLEVVWKNPVDAIGMMTFELALLAGMWDGTMSEDPQKAALLASAVQAEFYKTVYETEGFTSALGEKSLEVCPQGMATLPDGTTWKGFVA